MLWDKGLEDSIHACRLLRGEQLPVELNVAGIIDEGSTNSIPQEQVTAWHESGDIDWLGQVENMPELIAQHHVVVLPTCYGEGVPRILIEAAAIGRPIVTTDVSGCREIVLDKKKWFFGGP